MSSQEITYEITCESSTVYEVQEVLSDGKKFGYAVVRYGPGGAGWEVAKYENADTAALAAAFLTKIADEER